MPWIRLCDNYVDDEKFQALSDGAFRLWHEAMSYCRRHQTDGLIPFSVMRGLRSFTKGREKQLAAPAREALSPLWELIAGTGYKVHNYLAWNLSKEEEQNERAGAAARMRKFRSSPRYGVTDTVTDGVTNGVTPTVTNALVPDWVGMDPGSSDSLERESERKPDVISADQARFDTFWASYPRKVGKDAARKAWQKRRPSEELLQAMLAAVDWQKRTDAWLKSGGQYVPHPSTWLNEGRWQDEPQDTPRVSDRTIGIARAAQDFLHDRH